MRVLNSKGRHYGNLLSFRLGVFWPAVGGLWGPLDCLVCLWTVIGASFVTFGVPLGRLWVIIGLHLSPVGVH